MSWYIQCTSTKIQVTEILQGNHVFPSPSFEQNLGNSRGNLRDNSINQCGFSSKCKQKHPATPATLNHDQWTAITAEGCMAKHCECRCMESCQSKLKEIHWLYKGVDEKDLDNVAHEVIETLSETTSTMLQNADKQDVAGLQSFTIYTLNAQHSTISDINQYKLLNVKEDALTT